MPVLGNNSSGSIIGAFPADSLIVSRVVLTEDSADGGVVAAYAGGVSSVGNVKMLIYGGDTSYPGSLVASSAAQVFGDILSWIDAEFDGLDAGTYWVGLVSDVPVNVGYDVASGAAAVSASVSGYYASPPTTFPSGADEYPVAASIYYEYEAESGPGSATESFSDNVSASDAVSASVDTAKSDESTVSDSVAGSVGVTVANVSTVSDLLSIAAGAGKNDLLSASETVSVASAASKVDTATVGDTLSVSGSSAPADAGSVTDTVSFGASVSHFDAVGVTDIFTPPGAAENSDVSTISDSVVLAAGVEVRDTVTATDAVSGAGTESRTEASSVTDSILAQIQSAYADAAGIVDAIAFAVSAVFSEIFHISGIASAPESGATYVSLCNVRVEEYIAVSCMAYPYFSSNVSVTEYIKTSIIMEPLC